MPAAPPTPLDQREAELFAGREAELRLFEDRFDPPPARDERRVLLFTGVGGLGKSALARRIARSLKAANPERPAAWAAIDFAEAGATDPVQACLQIRLQLGAALKGARFPIFDVAFARYHNERYPGSDVRKQFAALDPNGAIARRLLRGLPDAAQDGELWKGVTEGIAGLIGAIPLVGFGYQQANKWFQREENYWDRRARPLLQEIEGLGADAIAARLPRCLGADIEDAIAGMAHRLPIAVIGDTAEAFHRSHAFESGIGAFHNDAWLRDLVLHSPGVLFVLLGRDPLEWHEHEHSPVRDWGRI
ncbi:MAG TPA: ATP-binding protein, partial [Geminicoccaceae bacterium]